MLQPEDVEMKTLLMFVVLAVPSISTADVCPVGSAQLADEVVEVEPDDCLRASYEGREWGGCDYDPVLWLTNDCAEPLLLQSLAGGDGAFLCGETVWDGEACDRIEPGARAMIALPPAEIGATQVVEIELAPEGGSAHVVTATYGADEVPHQHRRGGTRAVCSTTPYSAPSPSHAGLLVLICGFLFVARRRPR